MASRRRINPELMRAFEAAQAEPIEPLDFSQPGRIVEVPVPAEQFQQPATAPVEPRKTRLQTVQEYLERTRAPEGPPDFGPEVDVAATRAADARQNQMAALQDASMAFLGRSRGAPADVHTAESAATAQGAARKKAISDYYAAQGRTRMDEAQLLSGAAAEPGRKDPMIERERFANDRQRIEEQARHNRMIEEDRDLDRDAKAAGRAAGAASAAAKAAEKARLARKKEEKGKTLPATTVEGLADLPVAEAAIDEMVDSFGRLNMGGLAGKAGSFVSRLPGIGGELAPDSTEYKSIAQIGMQSVGKILEGGKLAAGDEVKYSAMLPRGGDTPTVVESKRGHLKAFLRSLVRMRAEGLKESGYNVPAEFMQGGTPAKTNPSATPDIPPKGSVMVVDIESGAVMPLSPAAAAVAIKAGKARAQ